MTNTKQIVLPKPPLKLVGEDGNAFMIIGRAMRAAKEAGWPKEAVSAFQKEAMGGSYDQLLCLCMEKFDCDADEDDCDEAGRSDQEDNEDEDGCYIEDFGKSRAELLEDEAAE